MLTHADAHTVRLLVQATIAEDDLRAVIIPDVDVLQWMPDAVRISVRAAIELLLAEIPRQPPIEVIELVNGAMASRIRRTHAARAVLTAIIAFADEQRA